MLLARPAPGPPRPYRFPAFVRSTLSNGVTLMVAPVRRLPICALSVVIDAGAELDPPEQEGLASLAVRVVAEGTAEFPGIAFTERLERIGASLFADADWDSAILSLSVLGERLDEALSLVAGVLTEPAFPPAEVERLRDERLSEILQLRSEPRGLANESFAKVLYTGDSRYATPLGGSEFSVRAIDRADMIGHHARAYRPDRTTVIVAGDVSAARVEERLTQELGSWSADAVSFVPRRGARAPQNTRIHVVPRLDAPQSELRVGHVGIPRAHRDYFPVSVMNAILGGLFSSRINLNLREEHAYTYGAHSSFDWRRGDGPFSVRTAVESGVTADAVHEIFVELRRLREEPVREDELSLAREYLAGVFPIRFETSAAIAGALAQLVTYDLPSDYYDTYRDRIDAVSVSDVLRAASLHLDLEGAHVVAVGDSPRIRESLESLQLGAVAELKDDAASATPVEATAARQPG